MGASMSQAQLQHANRLFNEYDTNNSGTISLAELQRALPGFSAAALKRSIKQAETDGNRKLDLNEAITLFDHLYTPVFQAIDTDNNGYITKDEFLTFLRDNNCSDGSKSVDEFLNKVDFDQSGHITKVEFALGLREIGL